MCKYVNNKRTVNSQGSIMLGSTITESLNQSSDWIFSDPNLVDKGRGFRNFDAMTAKHPVFVSHKHIDTMRSIVRTLTDMSERPDFQQKIKKHLPSIVTHPTKAVGVLFGYDFHLSDDGPKLIEVNTNAGAIYLNHYLSQTQSPCCDRIGAFMNSPTNNDEALESALLVMFKHEYLRQVPEGVLQTIAILDDEPEKQFLYDEFKIFQRMFQNAGIQTFIVDPSELDYDGNKLNYRGNTIDLIYNRHTDFYLEGEELLNIKNAYLNGQIVLTPNPRAYGYAADKRLLSLLSNKEFLDALGVDDSSKKLLLNSIPKTVIVSKENADTLWMHKKSYFFKPMTGYGSKATYHGAKLTRKTWEWIVESKNYIAQQFVTPSRRTLIQDGESKEFKVDIRNYVYNGDTLLLAARLYRGQATNMKTPGGGFATVYSTNE